ncbi:MAG TPA: ABC transporter substrate-binding protein, partial [Polyangiaceae bacterium]|nr:ABC transporter substrate-binding protein [Polyangiaceae bacterium]
MDSDRCSEFGRRVSLAALLAVAAGGCHDAAKAPPQGPIKVGLIASLTGNFSPLGSEDKKAVELAVEQVNAQGGLLGRTIELVERNDQTQPDQSVLA